MKKYLLLLFFFPIFVFADVDTFEGTAITTTTDIEGLSANIDDVEGSVVGGGAGCPSGTYYYAWDALHASGDTYACLDSGGSTVEGTVNAGSIVSNYFNKTDASENVEWSCSPYADDVTIWATIRVIATTEYNTLFAVHGAADSVACARISNTRKIAMYYQDGSTTSSFSVDTYTDDTPIRAGFSWDVSGDNLSVKLGTGDWETDNGEGLSTFGTTPDAFHVGDIGDCGATAEDDDTIRIYDVDIIKSYQAADPRPL
jgi:hypothetical protein